MDFQNTSYRGKKFRGRGKGRGKGRGGRGGRGRGNRGDRGRGGYKGNKNFDTASCNTQGQNDNRLIDTNPEPSRGWNKKQYKEYPNARNSRGEIDTLSTGAQMSYTKTQGQSAKLNFNKHKSGGEFQGRNGGYSGSYFEGNQEERFITQANDTHPYYNDWNYADEYLGPAFSKPKPWQKYNGGKGKGFARNRNSKQFESNASQKTEKSNTSIASEMTKNSRSEAFDKNGTKPQNLKETKTKFSSPEEDILASFQDTSGGKRFPRTFNTNYKRKENIFKSGSFHLKVLLESREIKKTIYFDVLREADEDCDHLTTLDVFGNRLFVAIEVKKLADALHEEINPKIDLRQALTLYISEVLQKTIANGNFSV